MKRLLSSLTGGQPIALAYNPDEPRDDYGRWTVSGSVAKSRDAQVNSPEFKRWFGGSKVTNSSGQPLMVFHGTGHEFTVFKHGESGRMTTRDSKLAHYFASLPDVADEWAWKSGDHVGIVKPVYLRMVNPLIVKGTQFYDPETHLAAVKKAKAEGHDGVIFKDQGSLTGRSDHYAIFESIQVKSATGNRGTFDPDSGDIRMSLTSAASQPSYLTQAIKADLDMRKVEEAGVAASQRCLARIRSGFMRSLASGGHYRFSAQAELLNHLVPVMAKTLAFADLMGQRRATLNWREAGLEPIALDRFSEVQKMIRDAGLGRDMTKVQRGYARRVYKMMRDAGAKIDAVTRGTVANLIATNEPMGRGSAILQATLNKLGVGDYSQSQIETIYATEVARAYHTGRRQMDMRRWNDIWGFRYVTMRDDRVRPTHASWEGTVLKKGNRFWKTHYPPCGWNCVPGNVAISGRVEGASRIKYDGPIVVLTTRNDCVLPVTPNHRVATSRGFIAAKDVRQGDNLINDRLFDQRLATSLGRAVNENDRPSAIEDVFNSIIRGGAVTNKSRTAPLDFHGDAMASDGGIDIVRPDRLLPLDIGISETVFEQLDNLSLVLAAAAANPSGHRCGTFGSFGNATLAIPHAIPSGTALLLQYLSVVRTLLAETPLHRLSVGRSSELDVCLSQPAGDSAASDAKAIGDLFDRFAGRVAFDKVVDVRAVDFCDHVYDVACETGYMAANGLIISNCRCQVVTIYKTPGYTPREVPPGKINGQIARADDGFGDNFAASVALSLAEV